MDVRTRTEEIERLTLAPWATFSDESRGRQRPEEQDPIRPVFQRDRDRVLHCKAFRRLKQKTQVSPTTLATPPSATPENGRWISSRPAASSTICRACGWWTSSRRTGRAST